MTYRRTNHHNIQARGYKEEGTITTALRRDGAELSGPIPSRNRYHRPRASDRRQGIYLKQQLMDKLIEHKQYIDKYGQGMPEIRDCKWGQSGHPDRDPVG
jgi:xylulose-5-phosphate/fructose-6-phosphate phosphoketolase